MKILINDQDGNQHEISDVEQNTLVNELVGKLWESPMYIRPTENTSIKFLYNGEELDENKSMSHYNIQEGSVIEEKHLNIGIASPPANICSVVPMPRNLMQINVQDLDGQEYKISGLQGSQSVDSLKEKIAGYTGIKPEEQSLMYLGLDLVDGSLLSEYNIVNGCTINMVHRSTGGN